MNLIFTRQQRLCSRPLPTINELRGVELKLQAAVKAPEPSGSTAADHTSHTASNDGGFYKPRLHDGYQNFIFFSVLVVFFFPLLQVFLPKLYPSSAADFPQLIAFLDVLLVHFLVSRYAVLFIFVLDVRVFLELLFVLFLGLRLGAAALLGLLDLCLGHRFSSVPVLPDVLFVAFVFALSLANRLVDLAAALIRDCLFKTRFFC